MHPLLAEFASIPIHTYGFRIAIGFLVAVFTARRLARGTEVTIDRISDITFWCLVVGFIGARILFIITRWSYFLENPFEMVRVWEGGLVFLGGPLAVFPFLYFYTRHFKLSIWKVMDILAPGLAISHAFGRLGCLSVGCCYGKPTGSGYGIRFYSDLVDPALRGIPLHPTQIYESAALTVLFLSLLYLFPRRKFDGQVALTYLLAYPVIRSIVEVFRGDQIRGFVVEGVLSTSQFISIWIFLGALLALRFRLKRITMADSDVPNP